jgi:hypothetical protein
MLIPDYIAISVLVVFALRAGLEHKKRASAANDTNLYGLSN